MKRCTKCGTTKPLLDFRQRKLKVGGMTETSWCRSCLNTASRECERKQAPWDKIDRALAAGTRPDRPPALTVAEHGTRWRNANRERYREISRNFFKTPHGRLKHRIQEGKRRAMMKGDLSVEQWKAVLEAHGHSCAYCRRTDRPLTIDHVVPVSRGGLHVQSNVVPACKPCNDSKNDAPLDVALDRLGVDRFRFQARRRLLAANAANRFAV